MVSVPDIILIKGAPGVGKSTAARLLASSFPKGALVEVDSLRKMVINVDWTCQREHIDLLRLAAVFADGLVGSGISPVLVVDTFSGDKVDCFLGAFHQGRPGRCTAIFSLHASPEALSMRLMGRNANEFRDLDVSLRINQDVLNLRKSDEFIIDTTEMSPTQVSDTIRGHLIVSN